MSFQLPDFAAGTARFFRKNTGQTPLEFRAHRGG
jgi:hypothetical protein